MYYLDSCVCVNFLRGKLPGFKERLERTDPRLFGIPAVVEAELLLGAAKSRMPEKNRFQVESFLLPFKIVSFDSDCAAEYAAIRHRLEAAGRLIDQNDLLIAATAKANGAALVTHNVCEFQRVKGLRVIDWSEFPLVTS